MISSNLSRSGRRRFWERHIAQWSATELTQVEYCRSNKISLRSFGYNKRKSESSAAPVLVEVPLPKASPAPALSDHPQFCIVVGRNFRIEISKGFDCEDLERILRVLGRI